MPPANYLNATIEDREAFNSEVFYTRVGSRQIVAMFKAGENDTPQARNFYLYLPRYIDSGIYQLNIPDRLIQIAFAENFPAHTSYWAIAGEIELDVDGDARNYSGKFNITFKDRQNREFIFDAFLAFSLKS